MFRHLKKMYPGTSESVSCLVLYGLYLHVGHQDAASRWSDYLPVLNFAACRRLVRPLQCLVCTCWGAWEGNGRV